MSFVSNNSPVAISQGGTAADHTIPAPIVDAAGNAPHNGTRRVANVKITNTHATQNLFVRKKGVATVTVFDIIVPALSSAIMSLPPDARTLSLIASGAGTTGALQYGNVSP